MPTIQIQVSPTTDSELILHQKRNGLTSKADMVLIAVEEYLNNHINELEEYKEKSKILN